MTAAPNGTGGDSGLAREPADLDAERAGIIGAFIDLCFERGYLELTPELVAGRAGVEIEAFGRHFADLEDCFCQLLEEMRAELLAFVATAFAGEQTWRDQIRAVAYAMLRFWRADAKRARLMLVEVHSAGVRAQLIRDEGMQEMIVLIDLGRQELGDPESVPRATAEALAGTVYGRMSQAIKEGAVDFGASMIPELMYTVVLPYLGPEAAAEELDIPPPG